MSGWKTRPLDEARLFNPAFLATLICAAAKDFERRGGQPMPWLLSFLVLPMALHSPTRQNLPKTITALFPNWVQEHPEIRAGLPQRATSLVPLTREAIRFGLSNEVLELSGAAVISRVRPTAPSTATEDVQQCFKASAFLGRWFTRHDPATLFALVGVRP